MKNILFFFLSMFSVASFANVKVIYGEDNRKDIYQVTNSLHLKLAEATAGMIHVDSFSTTEIKDVFDLQDSQSLGKVQNLCTSEPFHDQPVAPNCSGFLVGPDTIVTAGHCYKGFDFPSSVCAKFAWVFDYNMKSEKHDPTIGIKKENIYRCKEVIAAKLDSDLDYAVIKLDRPVLNRTPLKFRAEGKIQNNVNLIVIGHPTGLPTKVADGAVITNNSQNSKFSTNLDTFQGNSGSAVLDAQTGLVEGILIQGKNDYHPSIPRMPGSCKISNRCDPMGNTCTSGNEHGPAALGEVVLRITAAKFDIQKSLQRP